MQLNLITIEPHRDRGAASEAFTPGFDLTSISLGVFIGLKRLPPGGPVFRVALTAAE